MIKGRELPEWFEDSVKVSEDSGDLSIFPLLLPLPPPHNLISGAAVSTGETN